MSVSKAGQYYYNYSPEACKFCKYGIDFVAYKEEWYLSNKWNIPLSGWCARYPTMIRKNSTDYCGEFKKT